MTSKVALKAAKSALDSANYDEAIRQAQTALASDGKNYFAQLFLGRAYEKQGKVEAAAQAYQSAADLKPEDAQAWLGLCSLYEAQGSSNVDGFREASIQAAEIFAKADDLHRCQVTVDKLVGFAKQRGTTAQYKKALHVLLPGSWLYDALEGRIQHPALTYTRLIELTEQEETQFIKQQIDTRRTRIGARLGQVTAEVKREVFSTSELESLYQSIIDWSTDDEVRRENEQKLLERAYDVLVGLPADQKSSKLDQVLTLAEGMVIIHHHFQKAWDLVLETRDMDDLHDLDANILREYISSFADSGLAKVLKGWMSSELSPFASVKDHESDENPNAPLTPEDRLLLMTEGLALAGHSPLANRLVADYFLHLEEHSSAVETSRSGIQTTAAESSTLGLSLQNTKDALNSVLATALVHHDAPRNHPEARRLFEEILARKHDWPPALIGLGLIFEENEDYEQAISFLSKAQEGQVTNVRVGTELSWCRALNGKYVQAQQELEDYLPQMKAEDPRAKDLKAQTLYRIGICIWESNPSKKARRDRDGAYGRFLAAIKTNVNFTHAYTSLGLYYSEYARDKKRARQCFQKAFELSPAETNAAERLARSFADQGDWDIVEVIAQRVIDTGRARPPPGSKRKGLSWPYSALGVVLMNKQEHSKAITSFLSALRISPDDYQSYIGLGESYHNSGRYNSALRTFNYALNPVNGVQMRGAEEKWFAKYMLANVHRELGEYDEAIAGLEGVLDGRPGEFGVLMSLLQTFIEKSSRCIETGLFGQAIECARRAITTAELICKINPNAFNVWKAIGDACLAFSWVESRQSEFPTGEVHQLLSDDTDLSTYDYLADIDHISLSSPSDDVDMNTTSQPPLALLHGALAFKRAIHTCSHDIHAQAVACFNLGWLEYRIVACTDLKAGKKYLRAAVRCFKRAIELEAGNAEFWNALGIVTATVNPKVAQHSFVRSLHLNELNAKTWTNLGVLYLLQNDFELAHQAFGRAQSTDPDYAHAWVGEGLIAMIQGKDTEALSHFTHASEISDASSIVTKREYTKSFFDSLVTTSSSKELTALVQPIFAVDQLLRQARDVLPFQHLAALYFERVGNHVAATETLTSLCNKAEADYEANESFAALARFAHAKSDLARNQLAGLDFEGAAENAQTALDLSSDDDSGLDAASKTRLRLSAHLTAGLALHHLNRASDAVSMFKTALEESEQNPDVVCCLVRVLWAKGGKDERAIAREQLFDCVEKHPEHVDAVVLLGGLAALENDVDTMLAVKDDLVALRSSERPEIEKLLFALASLSATSSNLDITMLGTAQTAIALDPNLSQGWTELAKGSVQQEGAQYASSMAVRTTKGAVPPSGSNDTSQLSRAFAGVGTVGDAQKAVALAPWLDVAWEALAAAVD